MYLLLFEIKVIFILIILCDLGRTDESLIQFYEHGVHVPGEKKSFRYIGEIPPLTHHHTLNITPVREGFEHRYTYLKVEYVNTVSKVLVSFDHHTNILELVVLFPLIKTSYGVVGYSMPSKPARRENGEEMEALQFLEHTTQSFSSAL